MHAVGTGTVFCQAFGALVQRDLAEGETFLVDNRFMVAFSDSIKYQLVKATESVKDTLMSGEGLINRYEGPGRLYYQTRGKQTGGHVIQKGFDPQAAEVLRIADTGDTDHDR